MPVTTACSTKDLKDVAADLKNQYGDRRPNTVVFFASTKYDPVELSREMQGAFPSACVAGCSTAGEISCGRMTSGSVSVIFLDDDVVGQSASAVIENLSAPIDVSDAFASIELQLNAPVSSLDPGEVGGHFVG